MALVSVLLFSCASTSSLKDSRQEADVVIVQTEGHMNTETEGGSSRDTKEIVGSAEDGRVLHKDVIRQNARPGDTLKRHGQTIILKQADIDYSKAEVDRMNKELLDTAPGSIRALLTEIIEEQNFEIPGNPTPIEEINYDQIKGRVLEFISDIRNGKQIILIVTNNDNEPYFDSKYSSPPWLKSNNKMPPNLVAFTLTKNVDNNTRNEVFSFSEDIEGTKKMLKQVKEAVKPKVVYTVPKKSLRAPSMPVDYSQRLVFAVSYVRSFDFDNDKYGISLSMEDPIFIPAGLFSIDYLHSDDDNSYILGFAFGYPLLDFWGVYVGGGLGFAWNNMDFAWKVNGGMRLMLGKLMLKADVSYGTIMGPAMAFGIGFAL